MPHIVAEIGVNHAGELHTGMRLVNAAKQAGADSIKFQAWDNGTFPHLESLWLSRSQLETLFNECERNKICWFCTPFDLESAEWLDELGMDVWKIPSNDHVLRNNNLIRFYAEECMGDKVVISTGRFETIQQIDDMTALFMNHDISILHCVSEYPTPPERANLARMLELMEIGERLNRDISVGLSDHSGNIIVPIIAANLGAKIIEVHLKLERHSPDVKASLDVWKFKQMVEKVRGIDA
jgi:N,N'-diacetyllegionaminate synthase